MVKQAGDQIDYVAIHMMSQSPMRQNSVLNSLAYQNAPERAWEELMELGPARIEKKLEALEAELGSSKMPVAITEGHMSLQPHNANPILTEWLTGVYHARALNMYQRRGGRVVTPCGARLRARLLQFLADDCQSPGSRLIKLVGRCR